MIKSIDANVIIFVTAKSYQQNNKFQINEKLSNAHTLQFAVFMESVSRETLPPSPLLPIHSYSFSAIVRACFKA